jgi:hypothetical protein
MKKERVKMTALQINENMPKLQVKDANHFNRPKSAHVRMAYF